MCSKTVYKWSLVLFNIIFVILGAVTLGIGLYVKYDDDGLSGILNRLPVNPDQVDIAGLLSSASIVLIVAGAFMFGVGFLGCCGAWKELRVFLVIYAVILGLIFIMQVAAGIVAMAFRDKIEANLIPLLRDSLHTGYKDGIHQDASGNWVLSSDATSTGWDLAQIGLECCGVTSPSGYDNATAWNRQYTYNGQTVTAKVPISCCKTDNPEAFPDNLDELRFTDVQTCLTTANAASTNQQGCYLALKDMIEEHSMIVLGIAIGIGVVELLGLLFAYWLCQSIQKDAYKEV